MTYNFDPDRWYDNELAVLESAFKAGRLEESEYEERKDRLMDRYDEMMTRLDGTYRITEE
ncbi:MAG: gas vesicle protein GvpG [Deltaproteobacteria bacterium]|nr:gas vesicle protein GvpG [Deltaproteobacteria bacterium]